MIEVLINNKKLLLPEMWEELTKPQLMATLRMAIEVTTGRMSVFECKVRLFYIYAGITHTTFQEKKDKMLTSQQRQRKYYNVARLAEMIDFVFNEENEKVSIKFDVVENIIKSIPVGEHTWIGPDTALLNITFGEYRTAYDAFLRYLNSGDSDALNMLCATLYRPRDTAKQYGDLRIAFNPDECLHRADEMKVTPIELRFYVFLWFASCDRYLKTGDLQLEGNTINLSSLFAGSSNEDKNSLGLTGLLLGVADSGTFGPLAEVEKSNLFLIMLKLLQWHEEAKKIKNQYGKSK
ncbi:MAG: hypothetical protein ACRDDZ_05830 [Marinifilaceae bacterium]